MDRTAKMIAAACALFTILTAAPPAGAQTSALQDQITQHEQKLAAARAARSRRQEGLELITLGYLYRQAGQMQAALDRLNGALTLSQNAGNQIGQAMALNTMGRVYSDMGQEEKALDASGRAVSLYRSLGMRQGEANALTNMGRAYDELGKREEALKCLNDALAIWRDQGGAESQAPAGSARQAAMKRLGRSLPILREANGRSGEASTLDNLGKTYSDMGRNNEALEYFNQALPIWRDEREQSGEALTLNNMGRAYADLGKKQKALEAFDKALSTWRAVGNRQGEALTLNCIGRLYRDLGQHATALDYYNQALPIWREVRNRNGEGLALNDIGRAYADLGQGPKALESFDLALPIWRETGSRRGEAATLNNAGRVWSDLGQVDKALDLDSRALAIWREVQDRRGEALALATIGWAYSVGKQADKALASELAALSLARDAGDPEIEGGIATVLMTGLRDRDRREEAILFGTEAVNAYQQIRRDISGLGKELRTGFAQSKSRTYRMLAELLIEAGRLGEAERVLDLLKEQELKDVVRGAGPDAVIKVEPLEFTAAQKEAESELPSLEKMALAVAELHIDYAVLQEKAARTPEEDAQLGQMKAGLEQKREEILAFMTNRIYPALERSGGADQGSGLAESERSVPSHLQNALAKLGPRVKGIRLLLGERHVYAIVVTANTRKKVELKVPPSELRDKAFETLKALGARSSDPRSPLAQLYGMVVAPLEDELKTMETPSDAQGRAPTLLWSLDDALRYVPMAALYDGKRYMVERFNNVLFTPESYGHMTDAPLLSETKPNVLALGLSKSYGGLPPLPGVMPELDAVVHDPAVSDSHGPMEGKLLSNEQFTLAALTAELGPGKSVPVVHIASHFVVEAGGGEEPFLMLGGEDSGDANGYAWNLSDMQNSPVAFHGTRLLTLSACSTAKDYKSRDGVEMDSLGMIAQQKDAEAVLATLWDVNDTSTSRLMSDFYARWVKAPADGKAEALRRAQLAFLREAPVPPEKTESRGVKLAEAPPSAPAKAGYAHPYYWAPFVLIGNYK